MVLTKIDKGLPISPIVIVLAVLAIPFHLRPDNFIVDDGYFYPQIARHIAAGEGSTFNGWMPTNGYHPLWMLVCTLGAFITSRSTPLLQLLTTVQDLLTLFSLAVLIAISRQAKKSGSLIGCAVLLFMTMVLGIWRLLEANLALALQLTALVMIEPVLPRFHAQLSRWRPIAVGVMLGLTLLARLDLIFLVALLLVYQLIRVDAAKLSQRAVSVAIQTLCVAGLLAPYLLWNLRNFGHLTPISGAIKSSFPHPQPFHVGLFALPVLLSIGINALLFFRRQLNPFDRVCLLTSAGAAMHLAYTLPFGALMPWYLTTGYLSVALTATWVSDLVFRRMHRARSIECATSCFLFALLLVLASLRLFSNFSYSRASQGRVSLDLRYEESKRAFARALQQAYPAGTRAFIYDAPGGVAYYSGMSIVPADGLVTNYAYDADLRRQGFQTYAALHNIRLVIMPLVSPNQEYHRLFAGLRADKGGQRLSVESPLSHSVSSMELPDSAIQLRFRVTNPDLEVTFPHIAVWQLPNSASLH